MPLDTRPARRAAFVCALMSGDPGSMDRAIARLVAHRGPVRALSPVYAFDYTSYYEPEMGAGLRKQLACFSDLVDPAALAAAKHQTMEIERALSRTDGTALRRQVNLDPGLVSQESLVLATTKHSGHRICIAAGLYAEVTLLYQKGRYRPLQWTYPDYRTEVVQEFLQEVRAWLRAQRR